MEIDKNKSEFLSRNIRNLKRSLENHQAIDYVNWLTFAEVFVFPRHWCADVCHQGWGYSDGTRRLKALVQSLVYPVLDKTFEDYL